MALFGLIDAESYDTTRFKNHRRQILYSSPMGAAPLTALLSLCEEDSTDDPEFRWEETRIPAIASVLANISTTVVFGSTGTISSAGAITAVTAASGDITVAANDTLYFCVADRTNFSLNMLLRVEGIILSSGTADLVGVVIGLGTVSSKQYVAVKVIAGAGTYDYDAAQAGKYVTGIGMAAAEGSLAIETGSHTLPVEPLNYTQIHKYNYQITGTGLKTAVKYDELGPFPDQAKQNAMNFARLLEFNFLWGERSKVADSSNNNRLRRTSGGLLWHMRQWEAADSTYRGSGSAAATVNTDDNKRILDLSSTTLTYKLLLSYLERTTRTTGGSNTSNELLCYCGNQALLKLQELLTGQVQITTTGRSKDTFQIDFVKIVTPLKTLMLQSHPLFNENPLLRTSVLALEPGNLTYRYLEGRDMQVVENQQPNNADWREDGWLAECGLEVHYPEKFLMIKNLIAVE